MHGIKNGLSTVEIAQLNNLWDENGPATLLRFLGTKIAHEAADLHWGTAVRAALSKLAADVEKAASRF